MEDEETIAASVMKTGRYVIVHEATRTNGFGGELIAVMQAGTVIPKCSFFHPGMGEIKTGIH